LGRQKYKKNDMLGGGFLIKNVFFPNNKHVIYMKYTLVVKEEEIVFA
jgi:hypothetical protein